MKCARSYSTYISKFLVMYVCPSPKFIRYIIYYSILLTRLIFSKKYRTYAHYYKKNFNFNHPLDKGLGYWRMDDLNSFSPYSLELFVARFEAASLANNINNRKSYLKSILDISELEANSPEVALATTSYLIERVYQYLKTPPMIWNIEYLHGTPESNPKLSGSQLYHEDSEDIHSVKIWIYLDDVTNESGPTHILAKRPTRGLLGIFRGHGKKLPNLLPERIDSQVFIATGAKGDVLAFDACSTLHMGGRCTSRDRKVLMITYVSRQAVYYWPFVRNQYKGRYKKLIGKNDSVLRRSLFDV